MKAVSPTLFPTSAPHADHVGDSTAGAEEFGAVIAAALGIAQQPMPVIQTATSSSPGRGPAVIDSSSEADANRRADSADTTTHQSRTSPSSTSSTTRTSDRSADDTKAATAAHSKSTSAEKASSGRADVPDAKASKPGATPSKLAGAVKQSALPVNPAGDPLVKGTVSGAKSGTPSAAQVPAAAQAKVKQLPRVPKNAATTTPAAAIAVPAMGVQGGTAPNATSKRSAPQSANLDLRHRGLANDDTKAAGPAPITIKTSDVTKPPVVPPSAPTSADSLAQASSVAATATQLSAMPSARVHTADPSSVKGKPDNAGDAKSTTAAVPGNVDVSLVATAPPVPSTPLTPPAPHAAQATVPNTVPNQIVQVLMPLRTAKDGNYTVSLQLHPAELGPVTVRVAVHDGILSVQLTADQQSGHDALHSSLTDLRTQLQASGLRVGDVDLGNRGAVSQQQLGNPSNQGAFGQAGQGGQGSQHGAHPQPQYTPTGYGDGNDRHPSSGSDWYGRSDDQPGRDSADTRRRNITVGSSDDAALDVRI